MHTFRDDQHLLECHEAMFGAAGRRCGEIVLKYATTLFARPIEALRFRVIFAPIELGPYNRHAGYIYEAGGLILLNRHVCKWQDDELVLTQEGISGGVEDLLVHELTHARQGQILRDQHIRVNASRGDHRDRGWYQAISEAAPKYLGVEIPESIWPRTKSVRVKADDGRTVVRKRTVPATLTEVDMTHWPESIRNLRDSGDTRLRPGRCSNSCYTSKRCAGCTVEHSNVCVSCACTCCYSAPGPWRRQASPRHVKVSR